MSDPLKAAIQSERLSQRGSVAKLFTGFATSMVGVDPG